MRYWDAVEQATHDEALYQDKRKVYWHNDCKVFHTCREKVHTDVGITKR